MSRTSASPLRRQAKPKVWLVHWQVMRTNLGTRHFVGRSVEEDMGCVSTPITTYDFARRTGITSNGRPYQLLGPPGYDEEAEYVWKHYVHLWKFSEVEDVSCEYQYGAYASTCRNEPMQGNGGTARPLYGIRRGQL